MLYPYRSISLFASLASALLNVFCALRILFSWRSLRWDFSGVDDTDALPVNIDALHLLWGLLTLYFLAAGTASIIGFVGIARVRPFRLFSHDTHVTDTEHTELIELRSFLPGLLHRGLALYAPFRPHCVLYLVLFRLVRSSDVVLRGTRSSAGAPARHRRLWFGLGELRILV